MLSHSQWSLFTLNIPDDLLKATAFSDDELGGATEGSFLVTLATVSWDEVVDVSGTSSSLLGGVWFSGSPPFSSTSFSLGLLL